MDAALFQDEFLRGEFISVMQSFGCSYICLWSYVQPPSDDYLHSLGGFYNEDSSQASSSSGSLARQLFDEYRRQVLEIGNGHVPGLALQTNQTYIEMREFNLQSYASCDIQKRFYKEAGIKIAIFMGCKSGEIELGFSNIPQMDLEGEMRRLFPENFSRQSPLRELPQPCDPMGASSSSSSLKSLSMGSPQEYSSLLFTMSTTSPSPLQPLQNPITTQQAMQPTPFSQNIRLSPESEHEAMTNAILAVLTSPSSSSQPQISEPQNTQASQRTSAFRSYAPSLSPTSQMRTPSRRRNMLQRAFEYYGRIHSATIRAHMQGTRPTSTQLHHMISERRRREKLNESFQALRSLLPPGTKKDKASVLASTREHLSSLKAQVEELSKRNQILEAQLLPTREAAEEARVSSSGGRFNVGISRPSSASTSEEQIADLHVNVRGEACPMVDIAIRILEFLKQVNNVSLMSMEANTHVAESGVSNHIILRLRIEERDWDESAFQEAVQRVVADLVQRH